MRGIGWALIVLGLALALWSFAVTTTVHTDPTYLAGLGYQDAKDTYNLGLLQQQIMMLHSGIALFVAGTVAACVGDLRVAMRRAGSARYDGFLETDDPSCPENPEQNGAAG